MKYLQGAVFSEEVSERESGHLLSLHADAKNGGTLHTHILLESHKGAVLN
jgi:hypothetical protein